MPARELSSERNLADAARGGQGAALAANARLAAILDHARLRQRAATARTAQRIPLLLPRSEGRPSRAAPPPAPGHHRTQRAWVISHLLRYAAVGRHLDLRQPRRGPRDLPRARPPREPPRRLGPDAQGRSAGRLDTPYLGLHRHPANGRRVPRVLKTLLVLDPPHRPPNEAAQDRALPSPVPAARLRRRGAARDWRAG